MNNIVVFPILIPFIVGLVMVIFRNNIQVQRWLSVFGVVAIGFVAVLLMNQIRSEGIQTLQLGGWQAPFGISMVADMFSALLILTSSIVAFACLFFAFNSIGKERESFYFYPMFLFLLTGINGSFLTGDIFHLFVNFEVMLIASYVLISLGGKKVQLRESIKYVLINVISSFLFLVAIAYLYAVTGTLNLAHLSVRVAEVGQDGLLTVVAILFLIVFGLKAALFLFFWLPGSYSAPPTAVAAIFAALLTKVGIYAIFRMFTLVFYHEPQITHLLIGIMGALTMVLGAIGAVAHWDIKKILAYNVIIAVGFIIAGLASFTSAAILGSIYYLIHDIIIKALIFLLGGTVIALAGTSKLNEMSGLIRNHPYLGWIFFIAALSLGGIPPLSGFIGKVYITQGTFEAGYYWLGAIGLITSLMVLYSIMKIFMNGFWGETALSKDMEKGTTKGLMFPIALLTVATIALGVGAEGIHVYIDIATQALLNPSLYIEAVFGGEPMP
ncbi:Na+/H+ antiporter subunit D [Halalkalibacter nanhaiisediminis]|uniref:Multicomponent Na+:H+ antiporter subunit D n=1 Tax=Halalkalibacter nanhaiisediminis TaxID=688079 RepID=A0A562QS97_9BACI|nr:Na+/H+ antiporter subunit D [Halalkalibacter nanhaiisediminis]TWI59619.1 multicomponent Na+:H+ antiporter subunit D [Halalkalibacter nanhaiisediminis]